MMKILQVIIFLFGFAAINAQYNISGTVQNENGEPLIGASVFLHRSDFAAITDEDGAYVIEDIDEGYYLLKCTYLGYESFTEGFEVDRDIQLDLIMIRGVYSLENIEITANTLTQESPFAYTQYDREEIEIKNLGQDLPILLEHTPSMVVTSDAGNGVGYTGMRIRGTDASRINVTINGVPYNDSESHGVFWVNLPDFGSSLNDIQIQRGAGPSTNGSSAFGATVALNTNRVFENPFVSINSSYGSFNTRKLAVGMSTGLIDNSFMIEGRYSLIKSDGFVDRASSDLKSWYFSAAKINKNSSLRFNAFSGNEVTYQAWNGVPEAILNDDVDINTHYNNNRESLYLNPADSANLFNGGRSYNYYLHQNQVDDYGQNHMQLIYTLQASEKLRLNSTWHYTTGKGFFEEFKYQEELAAYNITEAIQITDLVRRRWLDNNFYGTILNLNWQLTEQSDLLVGASYNRYVGDHYGEVVASKDSLETNIPKRYYENQGKKTDFNAYAKVNTALGQDLKIFADAQYRNIRYEAFGDDNGNLPINVNERYSFFNPKLGLHYFISDSMNVYLSYAVAQKEPVRSDFTDAIGTGIPRSEKLSDFELGWQMVKPRYHLKANAYFMIYDDQLVLTGAINDVGAPIRVNVDDSYRMGIELEGYWRLTDKINYFPNISVSRNKIKAFDEVIVDYETSSLITIQHSDTDIAFSPNLVVGQRLEYDFNPALKFSWLAKYVGRQFLDNTSNRNRSMDAYIVNDLIVEYSFDPPVIQEVKLKLLVNNFLNAKYSSNGYTYSYQYGELITENFYYPQAGTSFLLNLAVTF